MICPKCGSRIVVSASNPVEKVMECECLHCGHEWKEKYHPGVSGAKYTKPE